MKRTRPLQDGTPVAAQLAIVGTLTRNVVDSLRALGRTRPSLARQGDLWPLELDEICGLRPLGDSPSAALDVILNAWVFADLLLKSYEVVQSPPLGLVSSLERLELVARVAHDRLEAGPLTDEYVVRPPSDETVHAAGKAILALLADASLPDFAASARVELPALLRFRGDAFHVEFDIEAQREIGWLSLLQRLVETVDAYMVAWPDEWAASSIVQQGRARAAALLCDEVDISRPGFDTDVEDEIGLPPALPWSDEQLAEWALLWAKQLKLFSKAERSALYWLMADRNESPAEAKAGLIMEGMAEAGQLLSTPQSDRVGSHGRVLRDVCPIRDYAPNELASWFKRVTLRESRNALLRSHDARTVGSEMLDEPAGSIVKDNGGYIIVDDDDANEILQREAVETRAAQLYALVGELSPTLQEWVSVALEFGTVKPVELAALTGKSEVAARQAMHRIRTAVKDRQFAMRASLRDSA